MKQGFQNGIKNGVFASVFVTPLSVNTKYFLGPTPIIFLPNLTGDLCMMESNEHHFMSTLVFQY